MSEFDLTKQYEDSILDTSQVDSTYGIFSVESPGCISASSRVVLADGRIVPISSLGAHHLQEIKVGILTGQGNRKKDIATVFHKYEKQPIIEVITESGKSIAGTHNHRLSTQRSRTQQWKRMDELKVGDRLQVIKKIPCLLTAPRPTGWSKPALLDTNLASLMGYLTGDGWQRKGYSVGCIINEEEQDLVPQLQHFWKAAFDVVPAVDIRSREGEIGYFDTRMLIRHQTLTTLTVHSKTIAAQLAFLRDKKRDRRVPQEIFESPDAVVAAYLRWFFEADGSTFYEAKSGTKFGNSVKVQLKSSSRERLRDVQILLLRFAIQSRINNDNLIISRAKDVLEFSKQIGFASRKKKEKLSQVVSVAKRMNHQARRVKRFERIVQINYLPPEDVYHIEIPGSRRFVANGIVSGSTLA